MFEVPIAMAALSAWASPAPRCTARQWRVALVAIAVLAAILPGGDPFSMGLLMIPQIVLYAVGIALAARFGQAPIWRAGRGGGRPVRAPQPGRPPQAGAASAPRAASRPPRTMRDPAGPISSYGRTIGRRHSP